MIQQIALNLGIHYGCQLVADFINRSIEYCSNPKPRKTDKANDVLDQDIFNRILLVVSDPKELLPLLSLNRKYRAIAATKFVFVITINDLISEAKNSGKLLLAQNTNMPLKLIIQDSDEFCKIYNYSLVFKKFIEDNKKVFENVQLVESEGSPNPVIELLSKVDFFKKLNSYSLKCFRNSVHNLSSLAQVTSLHSTNDCDTSYGYGISLPQNLKSWFHEEEYIGGFSFELSKTLESFKCKNINKSKSTFVFPQSLRSFSCEDIDSNVTIVLPSKLHSFSCNNVSKDVLFIFSSKTSSFSCDRDFGDLSLRSFFACSLKRQKLYSEEFIATAITNSETNLPLLTSISFGEVEDQSTQKMLEGFRASIKNHIASQSN